MTMEVTTLGTLLALVVTIGLILRQVAPAYAMMAGAFVGGICGGAALNGTLHIMLTGAEGMVGVVLRVLAAGVLAGVLIESGAAKKIAESILNGLGEKKALLAVAGATMILTGVGVYVAVAVLTIAPVALAIGKRTNMSKLAVLLAISGGGKAGNIISPNPNSIAVSDAFDVPLTTVMFAGVLPAVVGVGIAYMMARKLRHVGEAVENKDMTTEEDSEDMSLMKALSAPATAIFLLLLQPTAGIVIDPLFALPAGGVVGTLVMGKGSYLNQYIQSGLGKMAGVAILLLGTGTLAGVISNSAIIGHILNGIDTFHIPAYVLAPLSGIIMSGATGSTAAGTAVAGSVFAPTMMELGLHGLAGAAMVNAGATVLDHMPHGTYFHITRSSVHMGMKERFKLLPYETVIGLVLAVVSTLIFGVLGVLFL
ncbi:GntP family permease [Salipaludibacillus agaradhaerens]|uniref:GntP family permease n=1 Tax=Salipaludibacillus agaradhaerens TaxID=76935 RepID=UPI002150BBF9|nr:SLC13 family permease [Salipaludibacillus agaradhaerens]MCR6108427.1 GntP family permease [Salipaludibacillus agaradhaerens]MCR6120449.1 GntP family permease [Salipaludibacillus agaradhaerens]UJW59455.1 GntP family permease [Bacillus sp. A116_S68]